MIRFNANNCINCLSCMSIDECRLLIDGVRTGRPIFNEEKCKDECTKCIDMCGRALSKK